MEEIYSDDYLANFYQPNYGASLCPSGIYPGAALDWSRVQSQMVCDNMAINNGIVSVYRSPVKLDFVATTQPSEYFYRPGSPSQRQAYFPDGQGRHPARRRTRESGNKNESVLEKLLCCLIPCISIKK